MIYIKKVIPILEDPEVEPLAPTEEDEFVVYDFENMEFGMDALLSLEDADEDEKYNGIEEYDREEEDLETETANYLKNRESVMSDEEIEDIISRYTTIKDRKSSTFREIIGMIKDIRRACEESRKKHGSIHWDSDEDDVRKDDIRIMTKKEATLVVDAMLAERLPKYILAFEHFRRDSFKVVGFTLGFTIVMAIITFSALAFLIPITWFGVMSVTNMLALYRDMERTKLVIVKEIDRIQKTIASLDKKRDKDRIIQLTAIMNSLIRTTGYSRDSKEWKRLTTPETMKRIMESIDYHGDVYGFNEVQINILEADLGDELSNNLSGTPEKPKKKPKEEPDEPEEEPVNNHEDNLSSSDDESIGAFKGGDEPTTDDTPDTFDDTPDDNEEPTGDAGSDDGDINDDGYGGANMEDELNNNDAFGEGGTETNEDDSSDEEKRRKLSYVLDNLDVLHSKYKVMYDDFVNSDVYRVISQDSENESRKNIVLLTRELELALTSLTDYIMSGDKSSYPIVALKLSSFQNLLKTIDTSIYDMIIKDSELDINDKDGNTPKKKKK